jgi:hypothetical protein
VDREADRFLFTHVNSGTEVRANPGAVRTADWRLTFRKNLGLELTSRSDRGEDVLLTDSLPELADSLKLVYDHWFSEFESLTIPPIPLGASDSVVIPAHEGFLAGSARYNWSVNGWSNDWVKGLDMQESKITWPLEVQSPGDYLCDLNYATPEPASVHLQVGDRELQMLLSAFVPVREKNYSRIDRTAEAIGQSWARHHLGSVELEKGLYTLSVHASDPRLELLSVTLTKK